MLISIEQINHIRSVALQSRPNVEDTTVKQADLAEAGCEIDYDVTAYMRELSEDEINLIRETCKNPRSNI